MLLEFEILNSKPARLIWLDPADLLIVEDLEKSGPSGYRGLRLELRNGRAFNVNNSAGETVKKILAAMNPPPARGRPKKAEKPSEVHELLEPL